MVNEDCERFPIIPLPCFNPTMMNFNNFELTATGGDLYNFTEPQMLCSGTISSIRYCYAAASQSTEQQNIFQVLIIKQIGQNYTLDYDITVNSSTAQCRNIPPSAKFFCCGMTALHTHQYHLISPYNYSFGIRATNSNIALLRFMEGLTFPQVSIPATEFSFQVNDNLTDYIESRNFTIRDSHLLLLQLQIGITDGTQ